MFAQIATFLIDTIVSFLVLLLLARFHFQWLRVPFRNPMGEFLLATTNWIVVPARRVIPGLAGLDLSTLLVAWGLQAAGLWAQAAIGGAEPSALVARPDLSASTDCQPDRPANRTAPQSPRLRSSRPRTPGSGPATDKTRSTCRWCLGADTRSAGRERWMDRNRYS